MDLSRYDVRNIRGVRRYDGSLIIYTPRAFAQGARVEDIYLDAAQQSAYRDFYDDSRDPQGFLDTSRVPDADVRGAGTVARPPGTGGWPPSAGRALARIGGIVGIIIAGGELIDGLIGRVPGRWDGGGIWEEYHDCGKGYGSHANEFAIQFRPVFDCSDMQGIDWTIFDNGGYDHPRTVGNPQVRTYIVGRAYEIAPGVARFDNDVWFDRISQFNVPDVPSPVRRPPTGLPPPPPPGQEGLPGVHGPQDPNIQRWGKRGVGVPAGEPMAAPPLLEPAPPPWRLEITPGFGRTPDVDTKPSPATSPAPVRMVPGRPNPPSPAPPAKNEKEKKTRVKGKGAAIAVARILDGLSEIADMVEAVYTSLPAAVRRRVEAEERKRRGLGPRDSLERPGDSLGQYGINGADWRLRALWRHWDQIDAPAAVRALIVNEIEDRLYGRAYAARDRLTQRGQFRPRTHYRERSL